MTFAFNLKRLGKRVLWSLAPGVFDRLTDTQGDGELSIGIFRGESPLSLLPHPEVANPAMSRRNVTDMPADFVADPFMIRHGDRWLMFFEAFSRIDHRGSIGLATSGDGLRWDYDRIVLAEPFHLAYPLAFESNGRYFMLPDTPGHGIRLYAADPFPHRWRYVLTLVEGTHWSDATVFAHGSRWWMFAASSEAKDAGYTLRLFLSDALEGPWREHPASPVRRSNLIGTRPAGRVVAIDGKLVRFAQDCYPSYGTAVRAWLITTLTETEYCETEAAATPILQGSGAGWNADGMHHVDAHRTSATSWLASVDGWHWKQQARPAPQSR